VALSVGSPRLDAIQHRALWSSDFPRLEGSNRDRPTCLGTLFIIADGAGNVKWGGEGIAPTQKVLFGRDRPEQRPRNLRGQNLNVARGKFDRPEALCYNGKLRQVGQVHLCVLSGIQGRLGFDFCARAHGGFLSPVRFPATMRARSVSVCCRVVRRVMWPIGLARAGEGRGFALRCVRRKMAVCFHSPQAFLMYGSPLAVRVACGFACGRKPRAF